MFSVLKYHKQAGNNQRDILRASLACVIAAYLLSKLRWRQWHQKYKVCLNPPHWKRRNKKFTCQTQTFLSRQQPHLCDLHRQRAQGDWSQIYPLGSNLSWGLNSLFCSQCWGVLWRILYDPAWKSVGYLNLGLSNAICLQTMLHLAAKQRSGSSSSSMTPSFRSRLTWSFKWC